ncbi:hypothetical protein GCM10022221_33370 [Actinocorallia aurea]
MGGPGDLYLFDSVADLTPGAADSGAFKAASTLIRGAFVGIEPGIAFASDDAETPTAVVPYDDEAAAMRYANLVVRVDQVLAGSLGQGYTGGEIRLQIEHPAGATREELQDSLDTAGSGVMFVDDLAARQQALGRPITDPALLAYARTVHIPIGEGLFVADSASSPVVAPLMDPDRAAELLGYSYTPEDEVVASPSPTSACDEIDLPCVVPTGKPTDTATSMPAGGTETTPTTTVPPKLAALTANLVRAACAEGTATTAC